MSAARVWLPRRILLVHGKAEASFAHSKRFAQYEGAVHVGALRCEGVLNLAASFGVREACFRFGLSHASMRFGIGRTAKVKSCFCFRFNANGSGGAPFRPAQKLRCSRWIADD